MFGNIFKQRAHYVYNYKPRYYDERKERLENLKNKYANNDSETGDLPRISISKDQLRSEWVRNKKVATSNSINRRLAIIIVILVGILAYIFELHKLF